MKRSVHVFLRNISVNFNQDLYTLKNSYIQILRNSNYDSILPLMLTFQFNLSLDCFFAFTMPQATDLNISKYPSWVLFYIVRRSISDDIRDTRKIFHFVRRCWDRMKESSWLARWPAKITLSTSSAGTIFT